MAINWKICFFALTLLPMVRKDGFIYIVLMYVLKASTC